MKLVIYSDVLNHHQAPVADDLWSLTNHQFCFVEQKCSTEYKGGADDFSNREYLLRSWSSSENYQKALLLARTAECCVFSGIASLPFEKERLRYNLLSFEMGERWLKRGAVSLMSPQLLKWLSSYYIGQWDNKKLYKLCCSAYCAHDHYSLGTFRGKCYKWGYFTKSEEILIEAPRKWRTSGNTTILWCGRFLKWKHPELPVLLAERLKKKSIKFHIDMYGDGEEFCRIRKLADKIGVNDVVTFCGEQPNTCIRSAMSKADFFLFTSDKNEGWGVVANESMAEGCVLLASNSIGCVPYLINDGVNGLMFFGPSSWSSVSRPDQRSLDSLCERLEWILKNPEKKIEIAKSARKQIDNVWSSHNAAARLLLLIDNLKQGKNSVILEGPCSKA